MKYASFYALCIFWLLLSCGVQPIREGVIEESRFTTIQLDRPDLKKPITEVIDSLTLINLEYNENAIIADAPSVTRVLFLDHKLFILDSRYMSIKVFDMSGKYLYALGDLGIGRGQFTNIQDIGENPKNSSIFALCNNPRKLIEFSLNGDVLNEKQLPFWASNIVVEPSDEKLYYINQNKSLVSQNKNLLLTSPDDEVGSRLFDLPQNIKAMIRFTGGLYKSGGKIYFNPPLANKFYEMSHDTAKAAFNFDYGKANLPAHPNINDIFQSEKDYSFQLNGFCCNENFVGFSYFKNGYNTAFFDRHTNVVYTSDDRSDSLNHLFCNAIYECGHQKLMVVDGKKMLPFIKRNEVAIKKRFPEVHQKLMADTAHKSLSFFLFTTKKVS